MDNYHFYEEVGKGKYSVVHKARKKKTINYYAVKSLQKCRREKLMNEVKLFNSLDHMNVLKFYNWYESKNHYWAIFEYSSGGSLLQLIEQDKKMPEQQVQVFARDLVRGLHYLHSKGIVYCDLKPSTIILNEYGTLKYCDFGLARKAVDLVQSSKEVVEGSRKGTPSYMAPELFLNDGVHSFQSDMWSLGCLIYEMAAGRPPFVSNTLQELLEQIQRKEVERISGFSEEFHSFIFSLLQKLPLRRLSWEELISHPFLSWHPSQVKNFLHVDIPQQPHFKVWCEKTYGFYSDKNNSSKPVISPEGVDILRLSMNALNNLKKEQQFQLTSEEQVNQPRKEIDNKDADFFMRNRDEIIDIGCGTKRDFKSNAKEDQENWSDIRNCGDSKRNNETAQKRIPGISPKYVGSLSPNQNGNKQNQSTSPNSGKAIIVKNTSNKVSQLVLQNLGFQNRSRGQIQEESKNSSRTNALTSTSPLGGTSNAPRTPNSKSSPRNNSQEKYNSSSSSSNSANRTHLLGSGLSKINILSRTPSTPAQGVQSKMETTQAQVKNLNTINSYKNNQNTTNVLQNIVNKQQTNLNSPLSNSTKHYHSHSSSNNNTINKNSQHFSTAVSPHRIQHSTSTRSHNSSHNSSNTMTYQQESKFQDISQFSSNCNLTPENKKMPSVGLLETIERLLVHSSDLQVKPIIGHKDIEKSGEKEVTAFIKEILPFRCLEKEEIEKNLQNPEIQLIFSTIFQVLSTGKNNAQIINVLSYFENIIQSCSVANILLNSAFSACLLELLSASECAIRLKAATCLGMLLRFATSIDNSLGSLNLPTIIVDALNNEIDLKVRRKLIATLGEYLFYAATQVDEDPSNALWHVQPNHLVFLLLVIQRPDEDEELRFYASKTIENITTRSLIVGQQLCTSQAVQSLVSLFNSSLNQELQASAAISLMHISRINHETLGSILQGFGGPHRIADLLKTHDLSNKTLQAILTLVNHQLCFFPEDELSRVFLENENGIIEIISSFLESQHTILRGKSILALSLFITHSYSSSLIYLCGTKFFQTFDKLARDNFKYVQQCFLHLKGTIEKSISRIIQDIKEEVNRLTLGDRMGSMGVKANQLFFSSNHHASKIILHGDLQFINVLIEIASCSQLLKIAVVEQPFLSGLFELFNETSSISAQISAVLMNLFEIIFSSANLILDKRDLFVTQILPLLIEQLQLKWTVPATQVEWRFHSLKLIHDILCSFGEDLLRPQTTSVQRIHELLLSKFIGGILPFVLNKDEEYSTVGLLSLKLLLVLVENQPELYVTGLKQRGLLGVILSQFNLTSSRTILRIATRIVQVSSLAEITQLNIFSKSLQLFSLFVKKEQDQCYEDLLDIFLHVSALLVDLKPLTNIDQPSLAYSYLDPPSLDQQQFDGLLNVVYPLAFQLLGGIDNIICDKAQLLIIYILYIFGRHNSLVLSKPDLVLSLVVMIQQNNSAGQVLKRNTRLLSWMLQVLPVHPEIKLKIASNLEKILSQIKDFKSSAPIRDILNLLH